MEPAFCSTSFSTSRTWDRGQPMPLGERALNRPAAAKSQSAGREAALQLVEGLISAAAAIGAPNSNAKKTVGTPFHFYGCLRSAQTHGS